MSAVLGPDKFAPIRGHDGKYRLSEERLDWHLDNWAVWESARWDAELAYTLSSGSSSSIDFDEMCAQMDRRCAMVTGAVIASLTPVERCSVVNKLLAAVFRFPRDDPHQAWIRARWRMAGDLYARGLV